MSKKKRNKIHYKEVENGNAMVKEKKELCVGLLIENMDKYDFEPPYQRGDVWPEVFKDDLFKSILVDNIPIGPFHFVQKYEKNTGHQYVMDGRQRLGVLYSFIHGDYFLQIVNDKGKTKKIFYRDILDPSHKYHDYLRRIKEFNVSAVYWKHMDFKQQQKYFESINNQESLIPLEKHYGKYFLVKTFLNHLFHNEFNIVRKYLSDGSPKNRGKGPRDNYRNQAISIIHNSLMLNYGHTLRDFVFSPRPIGPKWIIISCQEIQKILVENSVDCKIKYNNEIFKEIGFDKQIKSFKLSCDWFDMAMRHKNNFYNRKNVDKISLQDSISFLMKKNNEKILTSSYVQQNIDKLSKFIVDWLMYKDMYSARKNIIPSNLIDIFGPEGKDGGDRYGGQNGIKQRSCNPTSLKNRFEIMEKMFTDTKYNIDISIKKKGISASQKRQAILTSDGICPVTGLQLTDDTTEVDHVFAKSVTGETSVVAISKEANQRKGDQTIETLDKTKKYMTENKL